MTMLINRCDQFNLALSIGPHAFPGGYPHYFVCADGEPLSFTAAVENAGLIRDAIIAGPHTGNDSWRVVGMDINWEDATLVCADSGAAIESAYGEDAPMKYAANWNMPGYMPDNDAAEFATFDEAKRYIIGEIKRDEEEAETEEEAEELAAFAEECNLQSGPFGATCGKYHYYVSEI